tara:strand:+ start:114 stop:1178 length:1065 start_codon:yes stop_codon:yes gene_type:complete
MSFKGTRPFEGWIHLVDPSPQEVQEIADSLPSVDALHPVARSRLTRAPGYDALIFPRLESHDNYLFGELAYPMWAKTRRDEEIVQDGIDDIRDFEVGSLGIQIIITPNKFVTVVHTPKDLPIDRSTGKMVPLPNLEELLSEASTESSGYCFASLVDHISNETSQILKKILDSTMELEKQVVEEGRPPKKCRQFISHLRSSFLEMQTMIEPSVNLVDDIINDELDLTYSIVNEDGETVETEVFPREVEIYLIDTRSTLRHDFQQSKFGIGMMEVIGNDLSEHHNIKQTAHGNRLTIFFSIFLGPTFVVGLYGMNVESAGFPEFGWMNGYLFAWLFIVLTVVIPATYLWVKRSNWR